MSPIVTRKARTDLERNRQRILDVARASFAADGLDLPMREIARRTGLGVATLYRHFPARQDLLFAVLSAEVERSEAEMQAALDDPDPGRALRAAVLAFGARQAHDRGLNEALVGSHEAGAVFAAERRSHAESFAILVERAGAQGLLREGTTVDDARIALRAIASFRALPAASAPAVISRLTGVLLAGLFAEAVPG